MTALAIEDIPCDLTLDRQAMTCIHGGNGPGSWVFGWVLPFVESHPSSMMPVVNLYETTNNFYADQMINQFQTTNVSNTGSNSNISVNPNEHSLNHAG
jgi:hypothetical protein